MIGENPIPTLWSLIIPPLQIKLLYFAPFFGTISASLARKLGAHLLTEIMEQHPDVGLDSYDRFFPNQDTLPRGGLGNLIALPLQKKARNSGNSVFIDENLVAC